MWTEILNSLIFGVIMTLLVGLYGYFIMPLTGRSKWIMPLIDMVLMILILGLVGFIMIKVGFMSLTFWTTAAA